MLMRHWRWQQRSREILSIRSRLESGAAPKKKGLDLPPVTEFEALKGRGARAVWNEKIVYIGGPRLLDSSRLTLPEVLKGFEQAASARGQSVVHLVLEDRPVASFALADVIHAESKEAVKRLHEMGVEVSC